MKRRMSLLLACMIGATVFAGCGSSDVNDNATTNGDSSAVSSQNEQESTEESSEENKETDVITIWHDNDESIMNTIADEVNKNVEADGIEVKFVKKKDLSSQVQLYGNDPENGPDMYMFAHDSLGTFAKMGILEPVSNIISTDSETDLLPMTIEAATYDDVQYLMPVYYESLLFIYNKDLWSDDIPGTTDELLEYMKKNTDISAGTYAVVNQYSTAYNVAPVINGFGGYIMNNDGQPGLNVKETEDAIAYNAEFAPYEADGDYNTITTLFNDQKAKAIIGGPWLISGIKDAGINYGIKSLTDFKLPNGNGLMPYSGVQCLGVMKYAAASKKDDIAEVLNEIMKPELGIVLAKKYNCAPANSKSYDDTEVQANEMVTAMGETAKTAVPMPNIPEMSVAWGPTEEMLVAVNKSGSKVTDIADKYQQDVLDAIADMQ